MHSPSFRHLEIAMRTCAYLKGTDQLGLTIGGNGNMSLHNIKSNQLYAYSDSSFCDLENSKSSFGYLVYMNGSPLTWTAKSQIDLALSTCEAEYIALSHATSEAIYLTSFLEELGYKQDTVPIFADNEAAIAICAEAKHHSRTRHIRMRYHHTRHEVSTGMVRVKHMKGSELPADLLTKSLPLQTHRKHMEGMCGDFTT